jgi:hypothetical protein
MARVEVDQSGRVEFTSTHTVLALSNSLQGAIRISGQIKREILQHLRNRARMRRTPKTYYLQIFAAGLFLLLRDVLDQLDSIVIDQEYPGKEAKEKITFRSIGKSSHAHHLALETYRGDKPPKHTISLQDLLALFR